MTQYSFDINYLVTDYIPVLLRKSRLIAWISCLLAPVDVLFNEFSTLVNRLRYFSKFTGQTAYLTKLLNEIYYGIRIEDGVYETPVYLHNKEEGFETVFLQNKDETPYNPLRLENKGEYYESNYDFKVLIPSSLWDLWEYVNPEEFGRLMAIIQQYTLVNKIFILERYE